MHCGCIRPKGPCRSVPALRKNEAPGKNILKMRVTFQYVGGLTAKTEGMMKENRILIKKGYIFGLLIIELHKILMARNHDRVFSEQLLVSGTAIGSCLEGCRQVVTREEYGIQLSLAAEFARQTHYLIRLLRDSHLIDDEVSVVMIVECEELIDLMHKALQKVKGPIPECNLN
jgi:four helix bundle protein